MTKSWILFENFLTLCFNQATESSPLIVKQMMNHRHPQILNRRQTALLIVDVQTKINAVMFQGPTVVQNAVKLIKAAKIVHVPILITEQYPQGLGATEPEIAEALEAITPTQKMTFSCCGSKEFLDDVQNREIMQVVVTGIETHVCVQQTVLDLLAHGFQVHVPKDVVSSRKELDHETALNRMGNSGAVLTSLESVLFELLEKAGTPEFKEVTKLIK